LYVERRNRGSRSKGWAVALAAVKYHYTTGRKAALILADKFIRPTDLYLERGERAVAWFTTRDTFEPTALPALENKTTGERTPLTPTEAAELDGGLYRFGLSDDHQQHSQLHPWLKICRLAGTRNAVRVSLERIARGQGGNPYTYWGSLLPISIFGCALEKSMDGVSWHCALTRAAGAGQ